MTPLMQSVKAVIAQAEAENTGDGHVAAATAFLHRAYSALEDKWNVENPPEDNDGEAVEEPA